MISISEKAVKELLRAIEEHKTGENEVYVRVAVKGGGCSGFKTSLTLDENKTSTDNVYEISGLKVVIDKKSDLYLEGVKLDFIEDLNRRGFSFDNPLATGTCGCKQSFSM